MIGIKGRGSSDGQRDLRQAMIRETNAFLAWATAMEEGQYPRIPARPVDQGGFRHLMRNPAARDMIARWWHEQLNGHFWG